MMKKRMKSKAVFLALCMVVSALVVMVSTVSADYDAGGDLELEWQDNRQEPSTEPGPSVLLIYNYDTANGRPYWLGDDNARITVGIINVHGSDACANVEVTMDSTDGTLTDIEAQDGNLGTTYTIGAIASGGGLQYATFEFDISTSADIGQHPIRFTISYERPGGTSQPSRSPDAYIYISSIFDNPAPASRDIHDGIPDLDEALGDTPFESGEDMQLGEITLNQYTADAVTDLSAQITGLPAAITFADGQDTAVIPTFTNPQAINWWLDVVAADPAIETGNIQFIYTRNGKTITETGQAIDLSIDYTPVVIADATVPDIAQGDKDVTIDITFENVGNVNLIDVWIRMSEVSISDGTTEFLFTPLDHYEGTTKKVDEWYQLDIGTDGRFTYSDTESSGTVTIDKEVDWMIPPGDHKVLFEWMGWYYNDGSIGDPSEFQHVVQDWGTEADLNSVMHNPRMWKDEGLLYPDTALSLATDVIDGDPWQDGAYIWITSTDTDLDLVAWLSDSMGGSIDLFAGYESAPGMGDNDVSFREIYVTFANQELVAFKEMEVSLTTGTDQPFLNPVDHTLASMDMHIPDSANSIDITGSVPGNQATFAFFVDINVAWWQSNAEAPGVYEVPVTVEATNVDTGVRITPTTLDVMMNINGFGPELFASMVSTDGFGDVGDRFTLSVEITNFGDDIAREVDAYLMAPFVSGWTILDQFSTSISSYGGTGSGAFVGDASWGWSNDQWHTYYNTYEQWNRTTNIKPGDVGVENVPQIVELFDWIKRRESPPQGEIVWMHLDRLGPGETYTFVFDMVSDVNMVEGMVYYVTLDLYYVDSNGNTYGPHGPMGVTITEDIYTPPQELLIRKGKGTIYADEEELDLAVVIAGIIIAIVILIFFLLGTFIGGRGKSEAKYSESDSYSPPPGGEYEPDMPPEGGDEGPPFPEEPPK